MRAVGGDHIPVTSWQATFISSPISRILREVSRSTRLATRTCRTSTRLDSKSRTSGQLPGILNPRIQKLQGGKMGRFPDDFPEELLLKIVSCFESTFDETKVRFDSEFSANVTTIQNLRLTCRRLCEASSQFLVPFIHVTPSFSSLNHLDEVANHPTISRGLRRIFVNMSLRTAKEADDLASFMDSRVSQLEAIIDHEESEELDMKNFQKMADRFIVKISNLQDSDADSYDGYDSDESVLGMRSRDLPVEEVLQREHERYRELYKEQKEILRSGQLTRTVAAAAARGRSNIGLYISDEHMNPVNGELYGLIRALREYEDPEVDIDFIVRFIGARDGEHWVSVEDDDLGQAPQSVVELPRAVSAAGANLTELVVDTSVINSLARPALVMTQGQISALEQVSRSLQTFKFSLGLVHCVYELGETKSWSTYVSALTGSLIASNLSLDLDYIRKAREDSKPLKVPPSDPCAIGPLRLSENLQTLHVFGLSNYAMHFNELEKLLSVLKPGVEIKLESITLLTGSWADALDHIRAKAGVDSSVAESVSRDASDAQFYSLFEEYEVIMGSGDEFVNSATEYIRSVKGVSNPFRQKSETA